MGKKSLRERLAESSSRQEAQDSAKRLAAFLKHWEEINEAYREGWSYKEIWRVLNRDGQIDFSYSTFLHFTRKLKRRQIEYEKERTRKTSNAAAATAAKAAVPLPAAKPGATRVDLPQFGQDAKARDPKRF